jgi:hypothetical protein
MKILDHFEKIIALAGERGLCDSFYDAAKDHLDAAASLLHINHVQTALFALLLERYGEEAISIDKLADTLKCGKMQLLRYIDDFDALKHKKLIRAARVPRFLHDDSLPSYIIPKDVINAVRKGIEYECREYKNLTPEEFFECAEDLLRELEDDEMDTETVIIELNNLFDYNKNICFVKKADEYNLKEGSVLIMLIFCCYLLHHDEEALRINSIRQFLGHSETRQIQRRFKSREHKLFVNELIEFDCQMGLADTEYYRLTQKAKDEFLTDVDIKEKSKRRGKFFIPCEKIIEKKLFYNKKIKNNIDELTSLLSDENFTGIQNRLSQSNMRTGFACCFSGPPGTGKTETAYQIARQTGRDIMLVDIAETKSMWFGESEKRIKAVFDRYKGIVQSGGMIPILLFNEADAVLGKRQELGDSRRGPGQTENTIQNIILQEMEDLNGILIATTNMTANFDKAFERRFLYKIDFEKPDFESKKLIWQSHITELSDEDSSKLAAEFDFSGGQIENIARKSVISFVLNGSCPDLDSLRKICREELMDKNTIQIGFNV